jgi:hypothetical protein
MITTGASQEEEMGDGFFSTNSLRKGVLYELVERIL